MPSMINSAVVGDKAAKIPRGPPNVLGNDLFPIEIAGLLLRAHLITKVATCDRG